MLRNVTIIVPIGPGEPSWRGLLPIFENLSSEAELLLLATEHPPDDFDALLQKAALDCETVWLQAEIGRARQMNLGANLATREFLWFLHADSRLTCEAIASLEKSIAAAPNALHYFDLVFQEDGPRLAKWNAWGATFRSRVFRLPFGDQGFCIRQTLFKQLGAFDESASFGEDHLFVWAAHRHRVPLKRVRATISTSARKYATNGWLRTTWNHFWQTWVQAFLQALKLIWSRLK